jgi:hypothetical protein
MNEMLAAPRTWRYVNTRNVPVNTVNVSDDAHRAATTSAAAAYASTVPVRAMTSRIRSVTRAKRDVAALSSRYFTPSESPTTRPPARTSTSAVVIGATIAATKNPKSATPPMVLSSMGLSERAQNFVTKGSTFVMTDLTAVAIFAVTVFTVLTTLAVAGFVFVATALNGFAMTAAVFLAAVLMRVQMDGLLVAETSAVVVAFGATVRGREALFVAAEAAMSVAFLGPIRTVEPLLESPRTALPHRQVSRGSCRGVC